MILTATIVKKCRKYWTIKTLRGYERKLTIDENTENYQVGQQLSIPVTVDQVNSNGTPTHYTVITGEDAEEARQQSAIRQAEKWLEFAEGDVKKGMTRTNAIAKVRDLASGIDALAGRLKALNDDIEANVRAYQESRQRQREEWAREKEAEAAKRAEERKATAARRMLVLAYSGPRQGDAIRMGGKLVIVESLGRTWRLPYEDSCVYGVMPDWEGQQVRYAYVRPATDEEVAELEAREAQAKVEAQVKAERETRIREIEKQIKTTGERPEVADVKGDTVLDSRTAYGGGQRFVIDEANGYIWYCLNNGGDGDDWSRTNVGVPGYAGEIGWRVLYSQELVEELRALNETEATK